MSRIVLHPTSIAQWHALVSEACQASSQQLAVEIESYLVFLLMRYTNQPQLVDSVLGQEFLACTQQELRIEDDIRDVGDKCLLFSGLFPGHAEKAHVRLSYYVDIGQMAYHTLSTHQKQSIANLYSQLTENFVPLMDVLHTIQSVSHNQSGNKSQLTLLQAEQLWKDTGSKHAYQLLSEHNNRIPLHEVLQRIQKNSK